MFKKQSTIRIVYDVKNDIKSLGAASRLFIDKSDENFVLIGEEIIIRITKNLKTLSKRGCQRTHKLLLRKFETALEEFNESTK